MRLAKCVLRTVIIIIIIIINITIIIIIIIIIINVDCMQPLSFFSRRLESRILKDVSHGRDGIVPYNYVIHDVTSDS